MCRLFGFVSHKPVAVTHLLEDIYESFVNISHLHGDGWGLAWYDENDHLQLAKAPEAAYASEEFAHKVKHIRTDMLVSHVRWATPGFPLHWNNTHPFTYDQMAFAHNGAVTPNAKLEQFIAPHLQGDIVGVTDSERYFLSLLSEFEQSPPIEAFRSHVRAMHEHLHSSSLNCLLLTPDALYAVCDFDAEAPLAQQEPDYFHLQYRVNTDAVVVASTGLNPGSGWKILQSGQMLVVQRATLDVAIVEIALNSRKSIKEQYKSALQR